MKIKHLYLTILVLVIAKQASFGQVFYEIGVYAGPVALYSDYGERGDFGTNIGNTGFGIGASHYINFSYGNNRFFNKHFMVRNDLFFHRTKLKHYGQWVASDRTSSGADKLRAMYGSSSAIEIGSHLEYFPMDVLVFNRGGNKLMPFFTAGFNAAIYFPKAASTMGSLNTPETTPTKYMNAFKNEPGFALAFVGGFGMRYKVRPMGDIVLNSRWTWYFSDWVDGLNPGIKQNNQVEVPENKSNDWLYSLTIGYIFYLD